MWFMNLTPDFVVNFQKTHFAHTVHSAYREESIFFFRSEY